MLSQQTQTQEFRNVEMPHSRRQDAHTAAIVNQAILYQERIGTEYAAAYLSCRGVSVDVAMRVLARPWQRRKI